MKKSFITHYSRKITYRFVHTLEAMPHILLLPDVIYYFTLSIHKK